MRSAKIYRHICRQFSRLQEATAGCSRTMADVFGSGVKRLRSAADLCEQLRTEMWLGREDSNLRMVESKSTALPLGDAPTGRLESGGTIDFPRLSLGNAGL